MLLLILLACNTPTGLAENDATMSPEAIAKKIQAVNANPPAEIIALTPRGQNYPAALLDLTMDPTLMSELNSWPSYPIRITGSMTEPI